MEMSCAVGEFTALPRGTKNSVVLQDAPTAQFTSIINF